MTRDQAERHVDFSVLLGGLTAATQRFTSALPGMDESFHALLEVLAWTGAIRDRLKADGRSKPPVVEGLYYVRNLVIHRGTDAVDWLLIHNGTFGGTVFGGSPFGGGGTRAQWWPLRDDLPAPRSKAGAQEYEDHIEGREVREVLEKLAGELAR